MSRARRKSRLAILVITSKLSLKQFYYINIMRCFISFPAHQRFYCHHLSISLSWSLTRSHYVHLPVDAFNLCSKCVKVIKTPLAFLPMASNSDKLDNYATEKLKARLVRWEDSSRGIWSLSWENWEYGRRKLWIRPHSIHSQGQSRVYHQYTLF